MSDAVSTVTITVEIPSDYPAPGGEPTRRVVFVLHDDDHLDDDRVTYTESNPATGAAMTEVDFKATGEMLIGLSEWVSQGLTEDQLRVIRGGAAVRGSAAAGWCIKALFDRIPGLSAPMVACMQAIDAQNGGRS